MYLFFISECEWGIFVIDYTTVAVQVRVSPSDDEIQFDPFEVGVKGQEEEE